MSRDHLTRDELVNALVTHRRSPYQRATLEAMDADELAAAANSSGIGFDELRRAAEGGGSGAGNLANLRSTFGLGDDLRRRSAANRDAGELGFEPRAILSGPRGEAAVDGAADDPGFRQDRDELGFEVRPVMSGPRGGAVVDRD